jgi:AraC-like DNA-binding protein
MLPLKHHGRPLQRLSQCNSRTLSIAGGVAKQGRNALERGDYSRVQSIPMVRANVLVPFVAFLESMGAPVERLLDQAKVPRTVLADPERIMPLHLCVRFLDLAARMEGLPDLGLTVGLRTRFHELGTFARLIRGAPTLHEALNRLIAAISLHNSGEFFWIAGHGEQAMFCHRYRLSDTPGSRQGRLFAVAMMVEAIRAVLGTRWKPNEVRLPSAEEPNRKRYEMSLGTAVVCSANMEAIVFARSLLAARPAANTALLAAYEIDLRLLAATAPSESFVGSMRQTIGALLNDGYPDIDRTAEAVGLSVRTLQRRLALTGESYHHLVDAVRFEIGGRLLQNSNFKLVDIAFELGYSDAANFTRAFKRWAGMTPRTFRRLHTRSSFPEDTSEPMSSAPLRPSSSGPGAQSLRVDDGSGGGA